MAKRGRKPKPTTALKLEGGYRQHRHGRRPSERPTEQVSPPAWLKGRTARAEWRRLHALLLEHGQLNKLYRTKLGLHCQAVQDYADALAVVRAEGLFLIRPEAGSKYQHPAMRVANEAFERIMKTGSDFGLSPTDWARLRADAPTKAVDPLAQFLERKSG